MGTVATVFGFLSAGLLATLPLSVSYSAPNTQRLEPVPERVTIEIPDKRFLLDIPPGLCRYPAEVVNRLTAFLDDQHVILGAGACADIANLMKTGNATVSFSIVVSILNSDFKPSTRRTRAKYLAECKAGFPTAKNPGGLTSAYADLERQFQYKVNDSVPTGLLSVDENSVTAGILSSLSRTGSQTFTQLQILACLAPADVPVLWVFQRAISRPAENLYIPPELEALRKMAQQAIYSTYALN